jgi:hypothetical protein
MKLGALCFAALAVLAIAVSTGASAGASKPPTLKVKVPPVGGFTFARFQVRTRGSAAPPKRARLVVVNRARLPRGLVVVARIGRLPGNRGTDVFVVAIRKRGIRTTSGAQGTSDPDVAEILMNLFSGKNYDGTDPLVEEYEAMRAQRTKISLEQMERARKLDAPPGALTLADLFKEPDGNSVSLVGGESPDQLLPEVRAILDTMSAPGPPTKDTRDELTKLIDKIEQQLQDDLNDDGEIGGKAPGGGSTPPPPPPPTGKLARYSFNGLGISYSGPAGAGGKVSGVSGSVCGDPLKTTWALKGTLTISAPGQADVVRPITGPYNASLPSLPPLMHGDFGGGTSMTVRVKYNPGAKPTMEILGQPVGAISNIAYNAQSVPVTVTPASC